MSALVNRGGNDDFCSRGPSLYSSFMDPGLFLSLAPRVDVYCPPLKRPRDIASFIFREEEYASVQKKQKTCSIDALPDECLFEILRRLPGSKERSISACVSKRWLMLLSSIRGSEITSQDSSAAQEALKSLKKPPFGLNGDVSGDDEEVEAESGGHLTRRLAGKEATDVRLSAIAVGTAGCGGLGELLVQGSHPTRGVTDAGLSAIARGCPCLRKLSLWDVPLITDAGLAEIANGCPMLERIDLARCPLITDKGLIAVARACPNLTSITLEACSRIGDKCLQAIGHSCSKLESISIKDCILVGDQGVANLVCSASASLAKIKLLGLSITDASLAVIGYYGKVVTDLVLSGLQNVNERGFWVMGSALGMQKLKSLTITSCCGVTDLGLEAVARGSPNLKQLCLRRCCFLSDAGLGSFARVARALENLQLEECNQVTLVGVLGVLSDCNPKFKSLALVKCLGIKDISYCPTPVPSCSSLRSLTIRDCPGFTSSSLAVVEKICPHLQQIDLGGLVGVTDAGLLPLIESSEPRLVNVNLNGCINLTDTAICALVRAHGETLQLLNIDGCMKITDKSLLAIADSCSVLVELDMSRCSITDYGVAVLACARQIDLQVFSLSGCSRVTERSLPFLGNLGRSLVGLNLQHCNLLSSHVISMLDEKLWWCDILS